MGKAAQQKKEKKNKEKIEKLPFVSICTPTFNRRPFIPYMIKCFEHQTYPKDKMEWIIIDDGTDKIEDMVSHIPQVKYFKYDEKMLLGRKRNLMHEKSSGEILVYMDDDDYYPPDRVMHAVETLQKNSRALAAGSSIVFVYFKHIQKMYQFGPYGPNHATAATFAFKRELLKLTSYNDNETLAEEKHFLKNYTVPFVQLNPMKSILVFSHTQNSFDKKQLLENIPNDKNIHETERTVDDFVKEEDIKYFFMNDIDEILDKYDPGKPEMKPDVMKQLNEIHEKRRKMTLEMQKAHHEQQIAQQLEQMKTENPQQYIAYMTKKMEEKDTTIQLMTIENSGLREKIVFLEEKVKKLVVENIEKAKRLKEHNIPL